VFITAYGVFYEPLDNWYNYLEEWVLFILHGHSPDNISVSGFNSTITFGIYLL
jgi:hypothetical protein